MTKEMVKKMMKVFGFNSVMEMVETVRDEIVEEEKKYTKIIPPYEYGSSGYPADDPIVYPDWVNKTLDEVTEKSGIKVHQKGESREMRIMNPHFAKYVILTCDDNGITLQDILEILTSAPAWCKGHGITRAKMELVFHILVLHRENRTQVKEELKKLVNKYDPISLKVYANGDEAFRYTLSHEAKTIAFAERAICNNVNAKPRFEVVKGA